MKKKVLAILLASVMFFTLVISVSAETKMYVVENEGLVDDADWKEAETLAENIESKYGFCVMFAITSDVSKSGTTTDYCRDMYKASTDTKDGVIFTHNVKDSTYSYYLFGKAEAMFGTSERSALWGAYDDCDTYADGLIAYYKEAEKIISSGGAAAATESPSETEAFVPVEKDHPLVVDNADVLTAEQESEFTAKLQTFADTYKSEISIITVNDLDGKTAQAYADDYYDYNGYGYGDNDDGMILLYKDGADGDRAICISTHGTGVSDYLWSEFEEPIKTKLAESDYVGAFNTYIELAEGAHDKSVSPMWIILSIVFGMLIGFAVPKVMSSGNKSVRPQANASVYARPGSMIITGSDEVFVNSEVTRVAKPKDNDNNTHTSSSGRSHGGGSSSF